MALVVLLVFLYAAGAAATALILLWMTVDGDDFSPFVCLFAVLLWPPTVVVCVAGMAWAWLDVRPPSLWWGRPAVVRTPHRANVTLYGVTLGGWGWGTMRYRADDQLEAESTWLAPLREDQEAPRG